MSSGEVGMRKHRVLGKVFPSFTVWLGCSLIDLVADKKSQPLFYRHMNRHHDQGNLQKKEFIEGLQFRTVMSSMITMVRSMADRQADTAVEQQPKTYMLRDSNHETRSQRKLIVSDMGFGSLKAHSRDTPPRTRPHLLILPTQFHQLGTWVGKHSDLAAYGGHSHLNHHIWEGSGFLPQRPILVPEVHMAMLSKYLWYVHQNVENSIHTKTKLTDIYSCSVFAHQTSRSFTTWSCSLTKRVMTAREQNVGCHGQHETGKLFNQKWSGVFARRLVRGLCVT